MKEWLKRIFYRLLHFNKNVKIGKSVILNSYNDFEGNNVIGDNSVLANNFLGFGSYISRNSVVKFAAIGRYCSVGSYVQTGLGSHPSRTFVSSHPAFFSTLKQAGFTFVEKNTFEEGNFVDSERKYLVSIGHDVWIGNNVIIMDGTKIGDGAIIAAGSVVTKDVLPYEIVGGVPAKRIRFRFTENQIQLLMKIKWWHWDFEKVKSRSDQFNDIERFLALYNPNLQ